MRRFWQMSEDFIWDCVQSKVFTGRRFVTCGDVVVLCEVVVQWVLGGGCIGFRVGEWVQEEGISPRKMRDVVQGVAGVFFLKVCLQYVDDLRWVCCNFIGGWVSYGVKFGLVFGVRLYADCSFWDVVAAFRAFLIQLVFLFPEGVYQFTIGLVNDCGYGSVAQGHDALQVGWVLELQYFAGLCLGLFGMLGVGCEWCVTLWVGEHALGRFSESCDSCNCPVSDFVIGGCSFVVVSIASG